MPPVAADQSNMPVVIVENVWPEYVISAAPVSAAPEPPLTAIWPDVAASITTAPVKVLTDDTAPVPQSAAASVIAPVTPFVCRHLLPAGADAKDAAIVPVAGIFKFMAEQIFEPVSFATAHPPPVCEHSEVLLE